jgi:hypothetical protein
MEKEWARPSPPLRPATRQPIGANDSESVGTATTIESYGKDFGYSLPLCWTQVDTWYKAKGTMFGLGQDSRAPVFTTLIWGGVFDAQ